MPVRRAADPLNVQYVWDAIKYCDQHKQLADFTRLVKYIQTDTNSTQAQAELYLKQTIQDDLVVEVKKVIQKGTNVGTEVECYKINKNEELQIPPDDGHDWYCIECHLAGDTNPCRNCFRVFHSECSTNARQKLDLFPKKAATPVEQNGETIESETLEKQDYIYDETLCSLCNLANSDTGSGLDINEFNILLNFIWIRIKSWVPENLTSTLALEPKYEWYTESELYWRAQQLFYQHMDMAHLDLKIRTNTFTKFAQYQADVYTMMHNIAIFHGVDSQEFGAAELMVRDMEHDISEIKNCVDCYKHSNEKVNNKWFCLPCRVPHKLVFAKQKGYPYWPAKVIRETERSCDVRFFSGKYERSVLPKNCIKPITTSINQLQIKKSASFNKALDELKLHQKLLENPTEVTKLIALSPKVRKRSLSTPKPKKPLPKVEPQSKSPMKVNRKRSAQPTDSDDIYDFHDSPPTDTKRKSEIIPRKSIDKLEVPVQQPKRKTIANPVDIPKIPITPVKTSKETHDVINISDVEDDRENTFPPMEENCEFSIVKSSDSGQEQVTSSTELDREDVFVANREGVPDGVMQELEQPYSDAVERMRRKLELSKDKKQLIAMAMKCMQKETDRLTNEHNDALKGLFEAHNNQISETKKKQWCFNCEQDAIYHCCWNTAYCSPTCQQQHWQAEHKKVCRRKR